MSQITRANNKIFKEIVGGLAKKNRDSLFGELFGIASAGNLISFSRHRAQISIMSVQNLFGVTSQFEITHFLT